MRPHLGSKTLVSRSYSRRRREQTGHAVSAVAAYAELDGTPRAREGAVLLIDPVRQHESERMGIARIPFPSGFERRGESTANAENDV